MEEKDKNINPLYDENLMTFAKKLANGVNSMDLLEEALKTRKKIDTDTIMDLMEDPMKNATKLQQVEEVMRMRHGILREIISYKANLPCYDHYLLPYDVSKLGNKKKLEKSYLAAVNELERYNIKPFCRWAIEDIYRKGEIFIIKEDKGDQITYYKIPNEICKSTHRMGMMNGFAIKLDKITEKILPAFPEMIQKLWKKYKEQKLKNDPNLLKENYYKLEIGDAICFNVDMCESKNPPYYVGLLADLGRIGDLNDLNMTTALAENFKILVQKLPTDEKGKMMTDANTASMYHQGLIRLLPNGVGGLTTPFDVESLTLTSNTNAKTYNYLTDLKNNLYDSSGVDGSLFNSINRSNSQAILYSGIIDSLFTFNLLERIRIWLNFDFQKNSALKAYKLYFCDNTYYNQQEKAQSALNNCTTWYSRVKMYAYQGMSPLEAYSVLKFEEAMGFDEYMKPLQNSHTMSSDDVGGRPKVEDENPTQAPKNDTSDTIRK